ncbi:MAG TPA: succinylglutamate desuccinylase/aspartoacylase family protein [Myxococcota bacterium]|nr:succinylglutamate desuccinylase/aspartoacylase family protein [Myxococcota bacterium]
MLEALLAEFEDLADGPVPFSHCQEGERHDVHLVLGGLIHGNETGSLPSLVELLRDLRSGELDFGGRLSLFVGNPWAARAGTRFLEADLNRVFVDSDLDTLEHRRARQLMRILEDADVFVDLHQTILPTEQAFYIFPWDQEGWRWARALAGAPVWVTRPPGRAFSSGTCCSDEFVRNRGGVGLTLELGQMGFQDEAASRAGRVMRRAIALVDAVAAGTTSMVEASEGMPELDFYKTVFAPPFPDRSWSLRPGLVNFRAVSRAELLTGPDSPELRAPCDGVLLFPKYPPADQPLPGEIVRVLELMDQHPLELWG